LEKVFVTGFKQTVGELEMREDPLLEWRTRKEHSLGIASQQRKKGQKMLLFKAAETKSQQACGSQDEGNLSFS